MADMKLPPNIGERLVVHGMQQKATVESVEWVPETADWRITLDWGEYGKSRTWVRHEGRVWFRWNTSN